MRNENSCVYLSPVWLQLICRLIPKGVDWRAEQVEWRHTQHAHWRSTMPSLSSTHCNCSHWKVCHEWTILVFLFCREHKSGYSCAVRPFVCSAFWLFQLRRFAEAASIGLVMSHHLLGVDASVRRHGSSMSQMLFSSHIRTSQGRRKVWFSFLSLVVTLGFPHLCQVPLAMMHYNSESAQD